jgi:hypothetical protein
LFVFGVVDLGVVEVPPSKERDAATVLCDAGLVFGAAPPPPMPSPPRPEDEGGRGGGAVSRAEDKAEVEAMEGSRLYSELLLLDPGSSEATRRSEIALQKECEIVSTNVPFTNILTGP